MILGYVEIDNGTGAYTYWCPGCVPPALRQVHREVIADEAEANEAECASCGLTLSPVRRTGQRDA